MKYWYSFFFSLILINSFSQTTFDLKKDFKAKGDDKTDDTKAFQNACARINKIKQNVILFIPKGRYLVTPQQSISQSSPLLPVSILSFLNCSNVTIKGEKGTKITFASSLYYGSFEQQDGVLKKLDRTTTDYKYRVAIGHGIEIVNCSHMTFRSLEIDGNNRNYILGGQFGDVCIQIDNDGVFIKDGYDINLTDLNLHHFGRDGVLIINKTPELFQTPNQNIRLSNCKFENNGRQGFSWAGGIGVKAVNYSFSYSGNSKVSSLPDAGVDFEPNAGYVVKDGLFSNCAFKSNKGVGVLADQDGFNVSGVQFERCIMQGQNSAALWIKSPSFLFTNCGITGSFYFGCVARSIEEGTKFLRCNFSDGTSKNNYLVEANGSKYLLFSQCSFRSSTLGLVFIAAGAIKPEERAVIEDCKFISMYKSTPRASFTTGVDFTSNTAFLDSGLVNVGWNLENSRFVATGKNAAKIKITSKYILASYNEVTVKTAQQQAKVNVLQNGLLSINTNARLIIGEKGKLIVKRGALWLAPRAELVIKGSIIAEEGAFLCIHQDAKISDVSKGNIKLTGKIEFTDNPQMKYGLGGCIRIGK